MNPFLILFVGMAVVVGGILAFRLHAFVALLFGALIVAVLTPAEAIVQFGLGQGMSPEEARALAETPFAERVARGFGRTCGQIGIVIAMASVIGICLLESGAADRIVRSALNLFGEKRAGPAFVGSSFLLAIPVFFDTVFYLMVPLARSMRLRTGKNYLLYVLAIVAGGTMAHSLVPPTPGPLFMADVLGVDMGLMILGGMIVGLATSSAGYVYARWVSLRDELPFRESEDSLQRLREMTERDNADLPSLWLSLLPIVLPVVLITAATVLDAFATPVGPAAGTFAATVASAVTLLGEKNMALVAGAIVALLMLLWSSGGDETVAGVRKALVSAGVIILIIGAGGAFGAGLQQTGIGGAVGDLADAYRIAILPMAFLMTVLIRTAQGSATVAMITAAGAFAGIADPAQLGFHPLYLAMVIGCGSKLVWWMNDSGFWVVSQMSGMTDREGLRWLTPALALMGITGLVVVLILAALFPLV